MLLIETSLCWLLFLTESHFRYRWGQWVMCSCMHTAVNSVSLDNTTVSFDSDALK